MSIQGYTARRRNFTYQSPETIPQTPTCFVDRPGYAVFKENSGKLIERFSRCVFCCTLRGLMELKRKMSESGEPIPIAEGEYVE